jgi:hypothetical protein
MSQRGLVLRGAGLSGLRGRGRWRRLVGPVSCQGDGLPQYPMTLWM